MTALVLWVWGCGTPIPSCATSEDCAFGETCDLGTCVKRSCATSAQCGLAEHCSDDGRCEAGCGDYTDCRAGETCADDGACVADVCVDTHLDCGYRESCVEGACVDVGPPHCEPCTTDDQCGAGNLCWADAWCLVDCSDGSECPGGFACQPVDDDGVVHQVCVTSCWMFAGG